MVEWLRKILFILPVVAVYLALFWFFYGVLIRLPANPYWKDAVSFLPVLLAVGCLVLYVQQEFAYQYTKRLVGELHAAHAHLSAYALRVEELTMLTERRRIARDLHDTLVQGLAGLIMQLDTIQAHARERHIERVQVLLQQVMEDTRETLTDAR
jgi:two-component system, NarL family, sensor histidine kinase YdfH